MALVEIRRLRALLAALGLIALLAPGAHADSGERVLRDPRITESSGLVASVAHPGVLWTHNDSGHPAQLFAVGPDGQTIATLTLAGVHPIDWEALALARDASGRSVLIVGDIGDNRSIRPYVSLFVVREPDRLVDAEVPSTEYRLRYPDGSHNAEALLVQPQTQASYVVTKAGVGAAIFAVPSDLQPAPVVGSMRRLFDAPPTVTDGAFAPDGSRFVLIGYLGGSLFDGLGGPGQPIGLPLRPQGESVAWPSPSELLVGSEGTGSGVQAVAVPATRRSASASAALGSPGPVEPVTPVTSGVGWWLIAVVGLGCGGALLWWFRTK